MTGKEDVTMILYFTGTGNSEYVARRISQATGEECIDLRGKIREQDVSLIRSESPWVLCAPVYAWQLPHIVRDWLLKTELEGSREIYFILTCGSGIGNAGEHMEKICMQKKMNYRGCAEVVMPENYIAMFQAPEEQEAREIIRKAEPVIDKMISDIRSGQPFQKKKTGVAGKLSSSLVNRVFYSMFLHSGKFRVSDSCNGCGLCERSCPLKAIRLENGKPVWQDPCTHCMTCICHCPKEAIEYGRASVGKPRYRCPV